MPTKSAALADGLFWGKSPIKAAGAKMQASFSTNPQKKEFHRAAYNYQMHPDVVLVSYRLPGFFTTFFIDLARDRSSEDSRILHTSGPVGV